MLKPGLSPSVVSAASVATGKVPVSNGSNGVAWQGLSVETVNTVAASGSGTVTLPDPSTGGATSNKVTLTGTPTIALPTPSAPCSTLLTLVQDGTGARTVTWPAAGLGAGKIAWPGKAGAPTLSVAAAAIDKFYLEFDGSQWYASSNLNWG